MVTNHLNAIKEIIQILEEKTPVKWNIQKGFNGQKLVTKIQPFVYWHTEAFNNNWSRILHMPRAKT